jgi:hypothetical protein
VNEASVDWRTGAPEGFRRVLAGAQLRSMLATSDILQWFAERSRRQGPLVLTHKGMYDIIGPVAKLEIAFTP